MPANVSRDDHPVDGLPPCAHCGYALTGLSPVGDCPECGKPVVDSVPRPIDPLACLTCEASLEEAVTRRADGAVVAHAEHCPGCRSPLAASLPFGPVLAERVRRRLRGMAHGEAMLASVFVLVAAATLLAGLGGLSMAGLLGPYWSFSLDMSACLTFPAVVLGLVAAIGSLRLVGSLWALQRELPGSLPPMALWLTIVCCVGLALVFATIATANVYLIEATTARTLALVGLLLLTAGSQRFRLMLPALRRLRDRARSERFLHIRRDDGNHRAGWELGFFGSWLWLVGIVGLGQGETGAFIAFSVVFLGLGGVGLCIAWRHWLGTIANLASAALLDGRAVWWIRRDAIRRLDPQSWLARSPATREAIDEKAVVIYLRQTGDERFDG